MGQALKRDRTVIRTDSLKGQDRNWDRLLKGPDFLKEQALRKDRTLQRRDPKLGQVLTWDRPLLGTGP